MPGQQRDTIFDTIGHIPRWAVLLGGQRTRGSSLTFAPPAQITRR